MSYVTPVKGEAVHPKKEGDGAVAHRSNRNFLCMRTPYVFLAHAQVDCSNPSGKKPLVVHIQAATVDFCVFSLFTVHPPQPLMRLHMRMRVSHVAAEKEKKARGHTRFSLFL
jgi:hypothetical protein